MKQQLFLILPTRGHHLHFVKSVYVCLKNLHIDLYPISFCKIKIIMEDNCDLIVCTMYFLTSLDMRYILLIKS